MSTSVSSQPSQERRSHLVMARRAKEIIRQHGTFHELGRCYTLHIRAPEDTVTFSMFPDGAVIVAYYVKLYGKNVLVSSDLESSTEEWLEVLERGVSA
jgi:hypothetical protein